MKKGIIISVQSFVKISDAVLVTTEDNIVGWVQKSFAPESGDTLYYETTIEKVEKFVNKKGEDKTRTRVMAMREDGLLVSKFSEAMFRRAKLEIAANVNADTD